MRAYHFPHHTNEFEMKQLTKTADAIFRKLIAGVTANKPYKKLVAEPYMPLSIDYLHEYKDGFVVALAHNYIQNSDVMCSPDCSFLCKPDGIFPMTYQQDDLGIYQEAVTLGEQITFKPRMQADLTSFCNGWMSTLKEQHLVK
jgi:hypothetical protein